MKISVVIPTKNRFNDLTITLKGICGNTMLPFEVIVVDQSAMEKGEELARILKEWKCSLWVRYFHKPEISSLIEARNFGVSQSSGEIIQFLDDDITVMPHFFDKLNQIYTENPKVDALSAVDISQERLPIWRVLLRLLFWRGDFRDNRDFVYKFHRKIKRLVKTRTFSGGLMSCKREVLEDIGFAPDLTGHVFVDDIDFSYRASKKYNLYIAPQLKAVHRGGLTPQYDIEEAERKRVHSHIYFYKTNVPKTIKNRIAFLWLMLGAFVGAVSRCVAHRSLKPMKGFLKGFRSV